MIFDRVVTVNAELFRENEPLSYAKEKCYIRFSNLALQDRWKNVDKKLDQLISTSHPLVTQVESINLKTVQNDILKFIVMNPECDNIDDLIKSDVDNESLYDQCVKLLYEGLEFHLDIEFTTAEIPLTAQIELKDINFLHSPKLKENIKFLYKILLFGSYDSKGYNLQVNCILSENGKPIKVLFKVVESLMVNKPVFSIELPFKEDAEVDLFEFLSIYHENVLEYQKNTQQLIYLNQLLDLKLQQNELRVKGMKELVDEMKCEQESAFVQLLNEKKEKLRQLGVGDTDDFDSHSWSNRPRKKMNLGLAKQENDTSDQKMNQQTDQQKSLVSQVKVEPQTNADVNVKEEPLTQHVPEQTQTLSLNDNIPHTDTSSSTNPSHTDLSESDDQTDVSDD
ncbi:BA75_01704T0 [Komagataella pastoris]|uniref:BA75_01704T0 n=1 Tax=Komagataella pastoris TaxID=4922 RepID=A0A1B2J833_PICPA|nr:BA75_01704T0 [Komagataella pastoris]